MNDTIEMYDFYYHITKQQSYWKQSFGSVTCNLSTNGVNDKLIDTRCYVLLRTLMDTFLSKDYSGNISYFLVFAW
mgnify:CR=1 FL=1